MPAWRKQGLVFCPSGELEWMQTHAALPVAESIGGSIYKVYFSCRDRSNRSHTAYVIFDLERPQEILDVSSKPVLKPGALGEFDDSGAMAAWLVSSRGNRYLYYIGWNLGVTVPFRNSIGLALSGGSGHFERFASGPILDRTAREPHFCASCCVIPGEDFWRMWYLSCTGWFTLDGKPQHRYHIKYAESDDGLEWRRSGRVAIDYAGPDEYAISRPSVLRDTDGWKMWYSMRGASYRIGWAESADGRFWTRKDESVGIDVSKSGWDSMMIEYPFVFEHEGDRYMLYNGNGYGRSGFGLAVME